MDELSPDEWQRLIECKKAGDDALLVWGCSLWVQLHRAGLSIEELETLRALLKRGKVEIVLMVDGKSPGPDAIVVGGTILN